MMATIPQWDISAGRQEQVEKIAEAVEREGVVILHNAAPKAEVDQLRAALTQCLEDDRRRYSTEYRFFGMVHALMTRGEPFLRFLENPVLRNVSRALLGRGCIVHAYNSSSLPPCTVHCGVNHSRDVHVDCPRWIDDYITNIGWLFPLDRFRHDNGAMEILPGGFLRETAPNEEEFRSQSIVLEGIEPGDAVCFNARCWHRGGENRTEQWRHAVSINVTRAYIRQQFDYPRMLPPKVLANLSEELQQFLGCFVRMPVSLEEFHLPPDRRPYRPGQE